MLTAIVTNCFRQHKSCSKFPNLKVSQLHTRQVIQPDHTNYKTYTFPMHQYNDNNRYITSLNLDNYFKIPVLTYNMLIIIYIIIIITK